jgi:hypothetical protein
MTPHGGTRRQFLGGTAGVAAAVAIGGEPAVASPARTGARARRGHGRGGEGLPGLPGPGEIWAEQRYLSRLTPLYTGSPNHRRYVDRLDHQLQRAGLRTQRQTLTFDYQDQRRHGLALDGRRLRDSGFWPYSGNTGPRGVTAPLYDAGSATAPDYSGARGRIVLLEAPTPALPFAESYALRGVYPPAEADSWPTQDDPYVAAAFSRVPDVEAAEAAGAVGVVCIWPNVSDAAAADQNVPFNGPPVNIPAVWVGNGNGARLKRDAAAGEQATLTMDNPRFPGTPTDNLWAVLPGRTDEVIIVNTHTDGCNAVEENGMIGVVALARCFARRRNEKTMVFLLSTGHFGHGMVPGSEAWRQENPELMSRAVACVTLEHLGTTEWVDDPERGVYAPTGKNQWGWAYTPLAPEASVFLQSVAGTHARRLAAVVPLALYFGEGRDFYAAGVPTISYLTGPAYLFTSPRGGEIDKLNPEKMYGEIVTFARCVAALDTMSAAAIRAFPGPAA